jgi:hypothetical protein
MQLSISSDLGVEKKYFLDVFVEVYFEPNREKYKCKTIDGYHFPGSMRVSCPQKYIKHFPDGTIFKMDVRLVAKEGYLPYFVATNKKNIARALEFFDYNIKIQNGFDYKPKAKKVVYIKEKTILKPVIQDVFETF